MMESIEIKKDYGEMSYFFIVLFFSWFKSPMVQKVVDCPLCNDDKSSVTILTSL